MKYSIYSCTGVYGERVEVVESLEEAKAYIEREMKGEIIVDDEHPCSDDLFATSSIAHYEVFEGEDAIVEEVNEDGDETVIYNELVFESQYYYND